MHVWPWSFVLRGCGKGWGKCPKRLWYCLWYWQSITELLERFSDVTSRYQCEDQGISGLQIPDRTPLFFFRKCSVCRNTLKSWKKNVVGQWEILQKMRKKTSIWTRFLCKHAHLWLRDSVRYRNLIYRFVERIVARQDLMSILAHFALLCLFGVFWQLFLYLL